MTQLKVILWNGDLTDNAEGKLVKLIENSQFQLEQLSKLLALREEKSEVPEVELLLVFPPFSCQELGDPVESLVCSKDMLGDSGQANLEAGPDLDNLADLSGLSREVHQQVTKQLKSWCDLAGRLKINLVPGSMLIQGEEGLVHLAPFIDYRGKVTGCCLQTHLGPEEARQGWQPGKELPIVDTPWGKTAILLNRDAWQPEVWRLVAMAGAEVVIALTMVPAPYTEGKQLAGIWQNLQQNQVFGVECSYGGRWQGQDYQRRNGLFAPCEMTDGFTGMVSNEKHGDFVAGLLDFARLQQVRRDYPLLEQLNTPLYERSLLPLYRRWQEKGENK